MSLTVSELKLVMSSCMFAPVIMCNKVCDELDRTAACAKKHNGAFCTRANCDF